MSGFYYLTLIVIYNSVAFIMKHSGIKIFIKTFAASILLAGCGASSSSPSPVSSVRSQQYVPIQNEDDQWRNSVALNRNQGSYSAQELVNYINGHFPLVQLNAGDYIYRCANSGEQNQLNFPSFFARTEAFEAFNHIPGPWNPSGLCTTRALYRYRVRENIQLTNLLTQKRYELPNGTLVNPLASVLLFHHALHRDTSQGVPRYKAHILDNAIDASLRDESINTQQILSHLHPQAIGRVVYFCDRILDDSVSRTHHLRHHINGWIDYDPAFNPPDHHEIPTLSDHDRSRKEEILLCNPEQYLDPFPELVRDNLL